MSKWVRSIGIATVGLAVFTSLIGCAYLQHPQFGALPGGTRLQAIERSPHHVDGEFRNVIDTPMRTQDSSFASNLMLMLFDRNPNLRPTAALPFTQVDFKALSPNQDVVVWLGPFLVLTCTLNGKRILIDPVFSTNASPLPFTNLAFPGTSPYTADDCPPSTCCWSRTTTGTTWTMTV